MTKPWQHQGYSLLAFLVLLILVGFAALEVRQSNALQQQLQLHQHARQTQILEHIRSGLLGFAANQGIHSQSHLGHLPCPALLAGDYAKTSCLNKPWGYLPVRSKIAVNYLNAGIDARNNELELSARQHWQYAVSAQLVQPNELGWGRWVDYSQPAIQIRIPLENHRVENNVAAVVAKAIAATDENKYDITPPYTLIRVSELQSHMARMQMHQFEDTLETWQNINPQFQLQLANHENLVPHAEHLNTYLPIDSACSCRCTKTRCTCACNGEGKWQSSANCVGTTNTSCIAEASQTRCTSQTDKPCVFNGPAKMSNSWPVSRFEPAAANNKSCRPTQRHECPLTRDSNPCTCDFSWPENTKNSLTQFNFKLNPAQ